MRKHGSLLDDSIRLESGTNGGRLISEALVGGWTFSKDLFRVIALDGDMEVTITRVAVGACDGLDLPATMSVELPVTDWIEGESACFFSLVNPCVIFGPC